MSFLCQQQSSTTPSNSRLLNNPKQQPSETPRDRSWTAGTAAMSLGTSGSRKDVGVFDFRGLAAGAASEILCGKDKRYWLKVCLWLESMYYSNESGIAL